MGKLLTSYKMSDSKTLAGQGRAGEQFTEFSSLEALSPLFKLKVTSQDMKEKNTHLFLFAAKWTSQNCLKSYSFQTEQVLEEKGSITILFMEEFEKCPAWLLCSLRQLL